MIIWTMLPPEEQGPARLVSHNLMLLKHYVELFNDAVDLAVFVDANRDPKRVFDERDKALIRWKMLAGRDAAVTLHNYAETKQAIQQQVAAMPSIKKRLDREALREANNVFKRSFPGYVNVRTSVAHGGVLFRDEENRSKHTVPGTDYVIGNLMSGDGTVSTSIGGKMASIVVDRASVDTLINATALFYAGYKPVEEYTDGLLRASHEEVPPPSDQD